jgi:2-polyprenyl-6-methoxyphenol hydroxylase-like FAD-dependent oxidoreductase
MADSKSPFHVIIIGGGLGGLALAQGLKTHGISCAVYEKDRSRADRLQGYRIVYLTLSLLTTVSKGLWYGWSSEMSSRGHLPIDQEYCRWDRVKYVHDEDGKVEVSYNYEMGI